MRTVKFGDILQLESGIIVHGCNSHGIMGSGIARQIKEKYPQCFRSYQSHCNSVIREKLLGSVLDYPVENKNLVICNAITQQDFGGDGKQYVSYRAIHTAFQKILKTAQFYNLDVHYPLIGAGLGGGNWSIISDIISSILDSSGVNHTLWIYE